MNNREIRFRALEYDIKLMWDVLLIDWDHQEVRVKRGNLVKTSELKFFKLLQFTDLHDKNGKPIFEGDIVEVWFPGMPHNLRATQEIMFIDGAFGCGTYPLNLINKASIEIIGNIFENSQLLNDQKNE